METTQTISLPKLNKATLTLTLIGDTPLICNRFSEKAKQEMLDKQMGKAKAAKHERKDPEAQFRGSLYEHPEGGYGFPTIAFKAAAVTAANDVGIQKVLARRAFHILGELVKIEGNPVPKIMNAMDGIYASTNGETAKVAGEPVMREDVVRLAGPSRVADIRFRGEFPHWRVTLDVVYNASIISAEQLVNLFQIAGFGVGVGEWRPERDGTFGLFHVATEKDMK